jgi:hypothetical protein
VTASLVLASMLTTGTRVWLPIGFVALAVAAAQQETLFGDDTALSATMIVILAAAGSFAAGGPGWLVGLCGLLGGLNADHLRCRAVRKLVVNSSCTTLAALMCAGTAWAIQQLRAPPGLEAFVGAVAAATVYWVVDNCLVAVVLTVVDGRPLRAQMRNLTRSETLLVPCAAVGFLLGFAGLRGALPVWAAFLSLVTLVAATRFVVVDRPPFASMRSTVSWLALAALTAVSVVTAVLGTGATVPLAVMLGGVPVIATLAIALERVRPGAGAIVPIMGAVIAASVFHGGTGLAASTAAALAGGLSVVVARRAALAGAVAALAGAVAIAATVALVSPHSEALITEAVLGASIGVTYLVAVHLVYAAALFRRVGRDAWRPATSLLRVDADVFVLSGLLAGIGVGTVANSSAIAAIAFGCVCGMAARYAIATRAKGTQVRLSDEQLLDVVRSAVLMLPASRPPDEP